MAFILTKLRENTQDVFSTRDLLELLGDRINDEIEFKGERYRISSIEESSSGGSGILLWQKTPIIVTQSGQTNFNIQYTGAHPEGLLLVVNGALYDYGEDSAFHIGNQELVWHGGFTLEAQDNIYIKELKLV